MTNTPETSDISPVQSARPFETLARSQRNSDSPACTVCDLAEAGTFNLRFATPNVPILAAFGADRLHAYKLHGSWDLDKAASENAGALLRSIRRIRSKDAPVEWDNLTFQFGPRSFLYMDKDQIAVFTSTPDEAGRLAMRFGKIYSQPPVPSGGTFNLIEQTKDEIKCQHVTLPPDTVLGAETLDLHYGDGSGEWHEDFVRKLRDRRHGLSIFEGKPGTGKTFYLRHLMGVLKESHRFYFMPTANLGVLSRPEFIGFWAEQRRSYGDRKFVVILEDSDAALLTRGTDNREQVSAILNLSDGLLADFLRLQIICTINCSSADIDPALLRPGRLLCHRVFKRLHHVQAARLAESLGKTLPTADDYSLAEIFGGNGAQGISRPRIGFAA